MFTAAFYVHVFVSYILFYSFKKGNNTDEVEALNFLTAYDREASAMCNNVMNTQWDFNTNITEATKQRMVRKSVSNLSPAADYGDGGSHGKMKKKRATDGRTVHFHTCERDILPDSGDSLLCLFFP